MLSENLMSLDTVTLQCFLAVAETCSFTKAADKVGRSQSATSQQISNLEILLGKQLFIRGRKISLTQDGEIFQGYARQILALHREAIDRFREPDLEGEVRFGLPEDFASVYLSDVLADFSRLHPRILLNVECDLTLNLYDRFRRKEFDLVLVKMTQPQDFPNGLEIWTEGLEWVNDGSVIHTDKPIPLVASPQPCVYRARAINALEKQGLKWRLAFISTSYASTIAAVQAGLGVTALPRTMIPKTLETVAKTQLPSLDEIHISILKHQHDNSAVNSLAGFVIKKLS